MDATSATAETIDRRFSPRASTPVVDRDARARERSITPCPFAPRAVFRADARVRLRDIDGDINRTRAVVGDDDVDEFDGARDERGTRRGRRILCGSSSSPSSSEVSREPP